MGQRDSFKPWTKRVPAPRVGLPAFGLGVALALVAIFNGAPRSVMAIFTPVIPLFMVSWGRAPTYGAISILYGGALAASTLAVDPEGEILRTTMRVLAVLVLAELVGALVRAATHVSATQALDNERYRRLVETSSVIPWDFDIDTYRYTYVGPQAEALFGYPLERWYAADFWVEHLHEEDRERAVEAGRTASASGEDHQLEYRMVAADGRVVWIRDLVSVVRGPDGTTGLCGVMIDITEERRAREEQRRLEGQVLEAQKLESLGLLAGGIAHDFNNLLTAVLGNAGLARARLEDDHSAVKPIEELEAAAERAADLTHQMLAYAGRASFHRAPEDLSEVARGMSGLLASALSKNVRLALDLAADPVTVDADATQVRQVLLNLLTNAGHALGEEGGVISVETGCFHADAGFLAECRPATGLEPGRYAFIEVRDEGSGMDHETVARMFDPFFSTKEAGHGLGLASALGIVRGHGGCLRVRSRPSEGTSIRLLLPPSADAAGSVESAVGNAGPAPDLQASGPVLLVDDEPGVRAVAREILENDGFHVSEAEDGEAALRTLEADEEVSAVVLDMTMPGLSGLETLNRIREIRPHIPVLLVSGYAAEEFAGAHVGPGPEGFLHKPFRVGELPRTLRGLFSTET